MASKNKVSIDNLADEVMKKLENYGDEIDIVMKKVTKKVGRETAKRIKETAPVKTGEYTKTWVSTEESGRLTQSVIVRAKKPGYRLAHLLERPHRVVRKGVELGTTKAHVHIEPAEKWAVDEFEKELRKKLE